MSENSGGSSSMLVQAAIYPSAAEPDETVVHNNLTLGAGKRPIVQSLLPHIAVLLLSLLAACRPGDVGWWSDSGIILGTARLLNDRVAIADKGMTGSTKINYGPFPIQVYQLLLAVSRNDILLVVGLKAFICAMIAGCSAIVLARQLDLSGWLGLAAIANWQSWSMNRSLWDNPLLIPLGLAALACYACFVRRPTGLSAAGVLTSLWLMLLTHLMAIPFAGAIALCALLVHRQQVAGCRMPLAITSLILVFLSAGYIHFCETKAIHIIYKGIHGTTPWFSAVPELPNPVSGLPAPPSVPATSQRPGRLENAAFAAVVTTPFVELPPLHSTVSQSLLERPSWIAGWVTCSAHILGGIGLAFAASHLGRLAGSSVRQSLALAALLTLVFQFLLYFGTNLSIIAWRHYFHGTFAIGILMIYFGIAAIPWQHARHAISFVLVGSMLLVTASRSIEIARKGNTPDQPSLSMLADAWKHIPSGTEYLWTNIPAVYENSVSFAAFSQVTSGAAVTNPSSQDAVLMLNRQGDVVIELQPRGADSPKPGAYRIDLDIARKLSARISQRFADKNG